MFDLGTIINLSDVPEAWIYKHYYIKISKGNGIKQPFDGRIIKVKSLLNRDTNPSLCFFYKNGHYYWRDFSQGMGGNALHFVGYHMNKNEPVVRAMICNEYEAYLSSPCNDEYEKELPDEIKKAQFQVITDIYEENSLTFWNQFKIDLDYLNFFKIRRGVQYKITKGDKEFSFPNKFFFAFYNSKGPYQLYQPGDEDAKYINIDTNYLIGSEQLEFRSNVCAIISGLKDICAISKIGLNCEYVAPPSENILLSKDKIEYLKSKYQFIITILDNDSAGLKAMNLYKKVYDIPFININLKKDLAENNRHYPIEKLKLNYSDLINKKINSYGS
jgi:hypothetical protein